MTRVSRIANSALSGLRVHSSDVRALAAGYLSADRDRERLSDMVTERSRDVEALERNVDQERLYLRARVAELERVMAAQDDVVSQLRLAVQELERKAERVQQLEQSHRTLATIAMRARSWRRAQRSNEARQALIDSVDQLGEA